MYDAGTDAPSGFDSVFLIVNVPVSRVSVLFVVTVTTEVSVMVTIPSFAVPDESVYVGVPNE